MKRNIRTAQAGYALILMVLALMGVGGVVLAGFTQGVKQQSEHERYLHNQRVLKEAKQALLQYVYNYPQMGPDQNDGPGRLLCPDTDNDNDGLEDYVANCGGNIVGRFPWGDPDLNFYNARDASGERLWYAVSTNFGRGPGSIINSGSFGGITVEDRSGAMLHDGTATIPAGGVVAVIIAPGAPIDRNGTMQVRVTNPNMVDPVNYLDRFGAKDNANFVNGDPNGFVTGPILDVVSGDLLVNDQMIVVTAAEVIAMAEKATLQAYRAAILDYLDKVACTGETPDGIGTTETLCLANGGSWDPIYPWLYNYDGVEYVVATENVNVAIDKLSSYFPADANFATEKASYLGIDTSGGNDGIFGRIPSIFGDYFTETGSQTIESRLVSSSLSLINPATTDTYSLTETYCKDGCPQGTGGNKTFQHDLVDDGPTLEFETAQVLSDVGFVDIDPDVVGDDGRFTATFPAPEAFTFEVYFWDEDNSPTGVWTACPGGADELFDCSRDSSGNPTPGVANGLKARILHMTVTLDFSAVENFDFDYSPSAPTTSITGADGTSHATITGTYGADNIISFPGVLSATYEFEQHWHAGDAALDPNDNSYATGTVDMTGFTLANLTLGIRYYPEIPAWAFLNEWHNSIRMAYALEYEPPGTGPCIIDTTCLQLDDSPGQPRDKISLLAIAGQHDWTDTDLNGRLRNDVDTVFDAGNENDNPTFYRHRGNDKILVIEEL